MPTEQVAEIAQNGRDWVDYLSALLTPTIAIFGSIIAFFQWWTNGKRLKHELFDRRYEQFEIVRDFIKSIAGSGKLKEDERYKFVMGTRGMRFVFDKELATYVNDSIYEPAVDLGTLDAELEGVPVGKERSNNVRKQSEIKKQLYRELEELEQRFAKYLQLRH